MLIFNIFCKMQSQFFMTVFSLTIYFDVLYQSCSQYPHRSKMENFATVVNVF